MGAIAIPLVLIGLAGLSIGILIQNKQNNNRTRRQSEIPPDSSTTSPSIWNEGLKTTFPKKEPEGVLCCRGSSSEPEKKPRDWSGAFPDPVGASDTGGQEAVDTGPTIYTTPNDGPAGATVYNTKGSNGVPKIHPGKQGKHIPEHNNFQPGKSELTHPDPQELLNKGAGKGIQHGNKEVVDFGENIGVHVSEDGVRTPTSRGTIHYDTKGNAHIVPASPETIE